jgi:hypothetical protein
MPIEIIMQPEILFRGVTQEGFDRLIHPDRQNEYIDVGRYTIRWLDALGYALEYAVTYGSKARMILLHDPSKYKHKKTSEEVFEIKEPIRLDDPDTTILTEEKNLGDLCAYENEGVIMTREQVNEYAAEVREKLKRSKGRQ